MADPAYVPCKRLLEDSRLFGRALDATQLPCPRDAREAARWEAARLQHELAVRVNDFLLSGAEGATQVEVGMYLGGAAGNRIDRLTRLLRGQSVMQLADYAALRAMLRRARGYRFELPGRYLSTQPHR